MFLSYSWMMPCAILSTADWSCARDAALCRCWGAFAAGRGSAVTHSSQHHRSPAHQGPRLLGRRVRRRSPTMQRQGARFKTEDPQLKQCGGPEIRCRDHCLLMTEFRNSWGGEVLCRKLETASCFIESRSAHDSASARILIDFEAERQETDAATCLLPARVVLSAVTSRSVAAGQVYGRGGGGPPANSARF